MSKRTLWLVVATVLTVAAAVGWMGVAQPPDASAHGPVTVRLLIQESGKCMEHNQTPDVHAHRCWSPNNNQKWEIVPYGAYHYLRNQGNNECLDLPNWNPNDGVIFQTFPCNYQTAQLFIIPTCTACWGEIRNVSSGKCVDLQGAGLADETPFWQWPCSGVSYGTQWFYFDTHNLENDAIWGYHWYQRYPQTHNYTTWMTLSFDRQVLSGGSEWDGYVTNAVNAWNGPASTNTIYLAESPPVDWHDVHLAILGGDGCYFDGFGLNTCLNGAWGFTTWFGASKQPCCPPPGDTIYYSTVLVNQGIMQGQSVAYRKDIIVHELGHAIAALQDIAPDQYCYTRPRPRIMDYDCVANSYYDGPQPFDSCAINHLYYDPNWGFAGC